MKLLLDTQLLLWSAGHPERLSTAARKELSDYSNELIFSAASIWEVTIKSSLGRDDFQIEPRVLRRGLIENGYIELPITSEHAVNVDNLPAVHKDPFDRMLVAQAIIEDLTLVSRDESIGRYDVDVFKI